MKMTYSDAIRIQTAQLCLYRQAIGRGGVTAIRRATKPCPVGLHPDQPVFVGIINGLVPRGGAFESLPRKRLGCSDLLAGAWHDAVRAGKI